jgi:hypothetical protein
MLTGLKDLDREVLLKLSDDELLKTCTIDKRFWNEVCDDNFLRRRLLKYPGIEKYKQDESQKQFFLRVIYYVSKMKEEYEFDYSKGDFKKQYNLLKENPDINNLFIESAGNGELSLIVHSLNKGVDIHAENDEALILASKYGHLEVVKYLVEKGADIHTQDDYSLRYSSKYGHLEVVKYLVEKGADIHTGHDFALRYASENGHIEVVKYLVENGADIHTGNDLALIYASRKGHLEVVKYLKDLM